MLKYTLTTLIALILFKAQAQNYSRVRVYANEQQQTTLEKLGVCLDHGKRKLHTWIETDLSQQEIDLIQATGIKTEVLIANVKEHYQQQLNTTVNRASSYCTGAFNTYTTPVHFKLGSMGGYPTYAEIMSDLDSMYLLYPTLVKQKAGIGTYLTHDGHTVDWMKISDNPTLDENEPEILITALHHAREPGSVTQLLYFMWYLLENYGTNAEITYLIDNSEIYLVPVINPDGYLYNELTDPGGGGLWRKNRRNNLDGNFGVDLNRNYSYQFGVSGVSSSTSSDVYLGPSAFSEPETQAIRDLVLAHEFKIAVNYHTYSNLLLYPYGYDYVTPFDKAYFEDASSLMVADNGFANIQAVNLYPASGDSDDWMYGDTIAKPRVFAFTPEVGSPDFGFWPPSSQIINLCRDNVFQNMTALRLLHYYCTVEDANDLLFRNTSFSQYFKYHLKKLGLTDAGSSTVSITPLSSNIASVGSPKTYTSLSGYITLTDSISFSLNSSTAYGDEIKFILNITNSTGTTSDTVLHYYGIPNVLFSSDFSSLSAFTNSGWSTTNSTFVSAGECLTESPTGNYTAFNNKSITTSDITIPSTSIIALARFYAKWEIEQGYDYAQFLISTNGGATFEPLCGKYTKTGTAEQDEGKPLYDDVMTNWVKEEIDLKDYIGQTVRFRFYFKSDGGVQADGIYIDDFFIENINLVGINEVENTGFTWWPNPATTFITVLTPYDSKIKKLLVYDLLGHQVCGYEVNQGQNSIYIGNLSAGEYIVKSDVEGATPIRLTVIR